MKVRFAHKKFAVVAVASFAGLGLSAGAASAETPVFDPELDIAVQEPTCPKDGKIDVVGSKKSITIVAPDGKLIAGYCVKAGSIQQGNGPETVMFDPAVAEYTFSHSSGKDISHYTVFYENEPIDDLTQPEPEPEVPGDLTNPEPQPEPEVPGDLTQPQSQPDPDPQPEPEFEAEVFPGDPQPEPQPQPQPQPESESQSVVTELPVTGSTTTLLAAIAAAITAAGFGVRRLGRRII